MAILGEDSTSVTTSKDSNKRVNKLGLISVLVQRASTKTMSQNQLSRESAALKSHAVSEKALKGQAIDTKAMCAYPATTISGFKLIEG